MNTRIPYNVAPEAPFELQSALFSSVNQFSSRNVVMKVLLNKRLSDLNEAERSGVVCTASGTESDIV